MHKNIARDPHKNSKTYTKILAVFVSRFNTTVLLHFGYYLPDFEILVRQFLLIKIYTTTNMTHFILKLTE